MDTVFQCQTKSPNCQIYKKHNSLFIFAITFTVTLLENLPSPSVPGSIPTQIQSSQLQSLLHEQKSYTKTSNLSVLKISYNGGISPNPRIQQVTKKKNLY